MMVKREDGTTSHGIQVSTDSEKGKETDPPVAPSEGTALIHT